MPYTSNPFVHRARGQAVLAVRRGASVTATARQFGVHRTTLHAWCRRAPLDLRGGVRTRSSRPRAPRTISQDIVAAIVAERRTHGRCAEVIHATLLRRGIRVGRSTVYRTLKRQYLVNEPSKWKRRHVYPIRPVADAPGKLVEMDTVHFVHPFTKVRTYCYTLIDVHSRWGYVEYHPRISQHIAYQVIQHAQQAAPFRFQTVQTDHGPEFGRWLTTQLQAKGIPHRHSRVRKPNDNAHIERFNRTIQDECLDRVIPSHEPLSSVQARLTAYLDYYNHDRLHLGLGLATPMEVIVAKVGGGGCNI
jgi:transposase InsO family protein